MELKYYRDKFNVDYPVGEHYYDTTYYYIKEVANTINKVYPVGEIVLVARGSSGSIISGGVAYILCRKGRKVTISISRKSEEPSHTYTLSNLSNYTSGIIIVIDDFISTGATLCHIISDLEKRLNKSHFDMLCVSNHWNDEVLTNHYNTEILSILNHFDFVCCNKKVN